MFKELTLENSLEHAKCFLSPLVIKSENGQWKYDLVVKIINHYFSDEKNEFPELGKVAEYFDVENNIMDIIAVCVYFTGCGELLKFNWKFVDEDEKVFILDPHEFKEPFSEEPFDFYHPETGLLVEDASDRTYLMFTYKRNK